MKKTGVLALALFLVFFCLSGALAQPPAPSLPGNLKIEPPAAGVSPRLAQLSGVWEGMWDYKPKGAGGGHAVGPMDAAGRGLKIAIVKITPPNVAAIYAFGGSAEKPGKSFRIRDASVAGDTIVLRWGKPGKKRTLTLSPTGNPKMADAKLQFEGGAKVLKAKLRKK